VGVTYQVVSRKSLSDAVFEQLRAHILSGVLDVGEELPSERALCEQFGVNRQALREALKRLQQLRLIAIKQGESTKVLDYRQTGGLELLVSMIFDGEGRLRARTARSFVEMRVALGPDIARLAATRRSAEQLARIETQTEALLAAEGVVARQRANLELWRVLVEASDNIAYRLAFNTMERAWEAVQDVVAGALGAELEDERGYRRLLKAIREQKAEGARRAAAQLVTKGSEGVLALLAQLDPSSVPQTEG
jgi:GntR family transcriptional repressor for pyruvate dehydrogenase complex